MGFEDSLQYNSQTIRSLGLNLERPALGQLENIVGVEASLSLNDVQFSVWLGHSQQLSRTDDVLFFRLFMYVFAWSGKGDLLNIGNENGNGRWSDL